MELKYFRLIKTIAEEGNIVNSSEKLFLTQSALSHQLIVLEERLGFKVFHRSRNKWKLTEEGEELYKLANEILISIEKGFNNIKSIKQGAKGSIRLSTECSTFYQGIPKFIQKMGILYPEIEITLTDATHQSFTKLLSKEIDAAIVTSPATSKELLSLKFYEDDVMALMNNEHSLASKNFLEASDFLNEHLIIQSFPLSTVSVYKHFLEPNNIDPIKISAGIHTEICLEMIAANMGIMCLPKWVLSPFKIPENVTFKQIGIQGLKRAHYLVVRKDDKDKKYMDDFINNFEEDFSSK
ncbi:LysR family transcriptional regulator [Aquimarina sp. 2201CG14-23]|uniref:LysR family transcriptional regulator n=1 Tax=Aquimarina mycalae TaxID=3040073 RepID=UPI002477DD49|nr:LysR family transcriptional regulator [Aquimarina sp. 2201CG14-23]MDH7446434.1 LysR family transcriptional regulator [Aquimarina sp. 2201CG14-23]